MKKTVLLGLFLLALPASWASSYYQTRLDDPSAVYLTKGQFPVHADGRDDDSDALQAAIDTVEQEHGEGILFVPEGSYRISKTIYVWPGVRIIGYGANRPVFVLAKDTPGYQQDLGYMFFFAGGRPGSKHSRWNPSTANRPMTPGTVPPNNTVPDANPGTFYSAMSNVDFDIEEGNPAAVAIRFHIAQHCFLTHMDFHLKSGLAALKDVGNEVEDLHFYGGDYGIITGKPSPGWQFTLLDSTFQDQKKAAIQEHEAGLTIANVSFKNVPEAISIDQGFPEELWIENSSFDNIQTAAITISNEKSPRTEINVEGVQCRNVPTFARLRDSGQSFPAPARIYQVRSFSHGLTIPSPGSEGKIASKFDATGLSEFSTPGRLIRTLPPTSTWIDVHTLGIKGDGVTDDTAALQKAIAAHSVLYFPSGRYVVSDTLHLQPTTILIGLHPSTAQFDLLDSTKGFEGPGAPRPVLETPPNGTNTFSGLGVSTGGINDRAVGVLWMAGKDSLMDDVRFLGGHGTNAADGTRLNPYNNTHTADPDIHRRWDSQYPSLWITNGGGGIFADIWTPSTFAQAGLYISNTTTPGKVFELSSEHHVRSEVKLDQVKNWELLALQTEEERGESGFALPLEISRSENITVANYHGYRVVSSYQPAATAIQVSESQNIRIRNVKVDSDSKASFDNSVIDSTRHKEVRAREFAVLDIPWMAAGSTASANRPEQLATGFFNISGAAVDPQGQIYFVDAHWQRIYKWSAESKEAVVVRDTPLEPVNLAFDKSGNMMVASYEGNGSVYTFNPATPDSELTLLKPGQTEGCGQATAVLPANVWDNRNLGAVRPWRYMSTDGSICLPAGEDFVQGQLYYGTKMADVLRAFSLAPASASHPFYLTDESDEKTYRGTVTANGTISDWQLFAEEGGESVAQDAQGTVYLAAGQVLIYDPQGKQVGSIEVPERPIDLVFGGSDRRTLFILTHHSLYSVKL